MRFVNHLVALALFLGLLGQPTTGSAQDIINVSFNAVSAGAPAAARTTMASETQNIAFNWLANGAANPSTARANAALQKYRVIKGAGTWICSPAGFGRNSVCYAG